MRVQDALGEAGGAGGVVELGRVVRGRVDGLEVRRRAGEQVVVQHDHVLDQVAVDPVGVLGVGDQHLRLRVGDAVADALVPVQHGHREQDRARLPGAEEHRGRLGRRRQQHRDAVPALDAVLAQHVRALGREVLQLAPARPSARCRASPPRPSRACRAGACRTRRRRCCSAPGRSTDARHRPARTCARPWSPRRRVYELPEPKEGPAFFASPPCRRRGRGGAGAAAGAARRPGGGRARAAERRGLALRLGGAEHLFLGLAGEQCLELVALDRLVLEQQLREPVEGVTAVAQHLPGASGARPRRCGGSRRRSRARSRPSSRPWR